jgi:nicotinate-nucleotide adenylyltransferase
MRLPPGFSGVTGLFGGTFDPIHHGHLRTALELRDRLGLNRVHFVLAARPPHRRQPVASVELRLRMLEAALADEPDCIVDRSETERDGPSYSCDTVLDIRKRAPNKILCLLLGMDAFLGLPSWHRADELLELANIVVARRPGASLPEDGTLGNLLARSRLQPSDETSWPVSGGVIVQDVTQLEISASGLRDSIREGLSPRYLVPESVRRIIETTGCYAE